MLSQIPSRTIGKSALIMNSGIFVAYDILVCWPFPHFILSVDQPVIFNKLVIKICTK